MANTTHVFDYLESPSDATSIVVIFGDEPFLKRRAKAALTQQLLGDDADAPFASFSGDSVEWRDVIDELSTVSLFGGGGPRLVVIDDADKFVKQERGRLEDYVAKPKKTGVLVLDVTSWASNTRLYKAVDKSGLQIECRAPEKAAGRRKAPDTARLRKWLAGWSQHQHGAKLEAAAADQLLELVGPEFGLLDQELAKLALFVADDGKITSDMVREIVGGWRSQTIWDLVDAAADGKASEALVQLDRLLQSGEHPVGLFAQMASPLRRLAAATRIFQDAERAGQRLGLRDALIQAGVPHWNRKGLEAAERQLKHLGRDRAGALYRWLVEADLGLKGSHSAPDRARFVLERLFLRMAGKPQARRASG